MSSYSLQCAIEETINEQTEVLVEQLRFVSQCNPAVIEDSLDRWLCAPVFPRVCPLFAPDAVAGAWAVLGTGATWLKSKCTPELRRR